MNIVSVSTGPVFSVVRADALSMGRSKARDTGSSGLRVCACGLGITASGGQLCGGKKSLNALTDKIGPNCSR